MRLLDGGALDSAVDRVDVQVERHPRAPRFAERCAPNVGTAAVPGDRQRLPIPAAGVPIFPTRCGADWCGVLDPTGCPAGRPRGARVRTVPIADGRHPAARDTVEL